MKCILAILMRISSFVFFEPGVYHVWFHHYEYGDCYADFHVGEEESEEGGVTILASLFLAK